MTSWIEYTLASPKEQDAIATEWSAIASRFKSGDADAAMKNYIRHCNLKGPLRRPPRKRDDEYEINWEGSPELEWGR